MASSEKYLAQPSGTCCMKGSLHEGKPKGRLDTIHNIETYFAEPDHHDNNSIVVVYPDVFGLSNNLRLIMDAFAEAGYLAVGLDYFRGDTIDLHRDENQEAKPGFDFEAWKTKHMNFAVDNTPAWLSAVKQKLNKPNAKYVCIGYCFGAPFVMKSLSNDDVVAGAFAHPAFLKESDFRNVKYPLFLSCAETDHTFGSEQRRRAIDILQEDKKEYVLQLFSGVKHGFALRADLKDPHQRWVKEQSFSGVKAFFDLHTSQK